jgi:hypothetical protein
VILSYYIDFFCLFFSDVPGPVLDLKPVVTNRKMCLLNWSDPADDGGSEITGFIIERKDAKMHTWRQPIETERSKCDITGLIEGQEYMFRVIAKNKFGCGPPVEIGPILAVDPLGKRENCHNVYKINTVLLLVMCSLSFTVLNSQQSQDLETS